MNQEKAIRFSPRLRTTIFELSRIPPLSRAMEASYRIAQDYCQNSFLKLPFVKTCVLKTPLNQRWAPGISDIDLILQIDDLNDPELAKNKLDILEKKFNRLRLSIPMLGEVVLLDLISFDFARKCELPALALLSDEKCLSQELNFSKRMYRVLIQKYHYALSRFQRESSIYHRSFARIRLLRELQKILRILNLPVNSNQTDPAVVFSDVFFSLAQMAKAILGDKQPVAFAENGENQMHQISNKWFELLFQKIPFSFQISSSPFPLVFVLGKELLPEEMHFLSDIYLKELEAPEIALRTAPIMLSPEMYTCFSFGLNWFDTTALLAMCKSKEEDEVNKNLRQALFDLTLYQLLKLPSGLIHATKESFDFSRLFRSAIDLMNLIKREPFNFESSLRVLNGNSSRLEILRARNEVFAVVRSMVELPKTIINER